MPVRTPTIATLSMLQFLTCSSAIMTYSKKATAKPGVKADDHAIIYTGNTVPKEVNGEEKLYRKAIRVVPSSPQHKLAPESRVNYAKVYTVEHNTKVWFIGEIHPGSEKTFFAAWKSTLESEE